jgi:hypothetical protein
MTAQLLNLTHRTGCYFHAQAGAGVLGLRIPGKTTTHSDA